MLLQNLRPLQGGHDEPCQWLQQAGTQAALGFVQHDEIQQAYELPGAIETGLPSVVAERLKAEPKLANAAPHGRAGLCDTTKTRLIVDAAKVAERLDS